MLRLVKPEPTTDDDKRRNGDKFDDDEHPERTVVLWQRPHTDRIKAADRPPEQIAVDPRPRGDQERERPDRHPRAMPGEPVVVRP